MSKTKEPTEKEVQRLAATASFLFFYREEVDALRKHLEGFDPGENKYLKSGIDRIVKAARLGDGDDHRVAATTDSDEGAPASEAAELAAPNPVKKRGRPKKSG